MNATTNKVPKKAKGEGAEADSGPDASGGNGAELPSEQGEDNGIGVDTPTVGNGSDEVESGPDDVARLPGALACVYLRGGPYDDNPAAVNALYAMAQIHGGEGMPFYCVTDQPDGLLPQIKVIPPVEPLRFSGWWQKLALFASKPFGCTDLLGHRIIYLDLDVVIMSSIEPLMTWPNSFGVSAGFFHGARENRRCNSSVMVLDSGQRLEVWRKATQRLKAPGDGGKIKGGDQAIIDQTLEVNDPAWLDDDMVLSYKKDVYLPTHEMPRRMARDPERPLYNWRKAVVVAFHGEPKPWEALLEPLIREYYPLTSQQRDKVEAMEASTMQLGNLVVKRR